MLMHKRARNPVVIGISIRIICGLSRFLRRESGRTCVGPQRGESDEDGSAS